MSSDQNLPVTRNAPSSAPLKVHAWSLEYIRCRLMAAFLRGLLGPPLRISGYLQPMLPDVTRKEITIPSRQKGRSIKIHVYAPKSLPASGKPAVHLNAHGSGFVLPSLGSDKEFCALLASKNQQVVLDCDYRKAPENPHPAAIQDYEDCLIWAMSQSSQYDLSRISIGGFSAGANLALATSTLHGASLTSCIAFYPPTNFSVSRSRKKAPEKHAAALPPWIAQFFDRSYIVAGTDRDDPLISPLFAQASSFPRNVWITCARGDTLYNDGKEQIERLKAADDAGNTPIRAEFHSVNGEGHGFDKVARKGTDRGKKKDEAFSLAIDFVKSSWDKSQGVERNGAKL